MTINIRTNHHPMDVLLVLGDTEAVREIRFALESASINDRLHHIGDVTEARSYLRQNPPYADAPTPGLIILEAGLHKKSDVDLLDVLYTDPRFADMSVIILAGSPSATRLHEDCFYVTDTERQPPINLTKLVDVLTSSRP